MDKAIEHFEKYAADKITKCPDKNKEQCYAEFIKTFKYIIAEERIVKIENQLRANAYYRRSPEEQAIIDEKLVQIMENACSKTQLIDDIDTILKKE